MRLAFAALLSAGLLAVPLVSGADTAPGSGPRVITPDLHAPVPIPTVVTGPPASPSSPTVWLQPSVDRQIILSNISESMTPLGSHGCMQFTITAALNTTDATTILGIYVKNETLTAARVYAPPSVTYLLFNGQIKSYSASANASGSSATFTLVEQRYSVQSGGNSVNAVC
jgi:hypothetical protein